MYAPNFRYEDWNKSGLKWYHGTGRGYGEKILQDGFVRPRRDDDYSKYSGPDDELIPLPGRVYVTTSPNLAAQYAMDGTLFEPFDPYEKKYCFVFEVEIDGDIDVVIDEDLIAEDDARLKRMANKTGNKNLSGVKGAFAEGTISAGKLAEYETSIAKQITLAASDEDAIAETKAILEEKGFVSLAVKGPVRVVRAWKIPQSAWLRRAPKNAANMDGWEEVGMVRNGSWSQYVRGEYWYYEGILYEADSTYGKGHEDVAMDLLIDMDKVREVVNDIYSRKGVPIPDWFDEETLASEAIHRRIINGRKPLSLSEHEFERAWRAALGKEHFDTWQAVETGGRFLQGDYERSFSMELLKKGGVRILNGYVEVWKLDKKTLESVQSALWDLVQDMNPDGRVALEEVHPERRSVKIDLAELLDAKSPKQVWDAAVYAKNGVFASDGGGVRAIYYNCTDGYRWVDLGKNESHEEFARKKGKDLAALIEAGAITQWDGVFHMARLSKRAKEAISDRLASKMPKGITDVDLYTSSSEQYAPDRYYGRLSVEQVLAGDFDVVPPSYSRNGSGYYVWVIDEDGNPVEADGVSGPHEMQNAKDYARIAATNGKRDRVVSKGVDPLSKSFKIVQIYRHQR